MSSQLQRTLEWQRRPGARKTSSEQGVGFSYREMNSGCVPEAPRYRCDEAMLARKAFHVSNISFESTSTALSLAIGSEWTFSHFTVGGDWVGYTVPIVANFISENSIGPNANLITPSLEKEKSKITGNVTQLLRFYIGLSF